MSEQKKSTLDVQSESGPVRKSSVNSGGPTIEMILKVPNFDGVTSHQVADMFLRSEEFYVERALRVVSETFEIRLRNHIKVERPILTEQEINHIFLNISQIYDFNRKLYTELLALRLDGKLVEEVGNCMIKHMPFFKLYTQYIKEYRKSQALVDQFAEKKRKFDEFLELNEMCAGHALKTLLLAPVCRLPQYLVFLGAILRSHEQNTAIANILEQAVKAVQNVTDDIAYSLRDQVARKLVVTIQQKIFKGNCDLISPHRFVVKHSDLKKVWEKQMRHVSNGKVYLFVLFNDMLLYGTKPGKLSSGEVKHALQLNGLTVEEVSDTDKIKNAFRVTSNTKSFIVSALNGPVKQSWIQAIKEAVNHYGKSAGTLQKTTLNGDEFEKLVKRKANAKVDPNANAPINTTNRPIGNTRPITTTGNSSTTASTTSSTTTGSRFNVGGGSSGFGITNNTNSTYGGDSGYSDPNNNTDYNNNNNNNGYGDQSGGYGNNDYNNNTSNDNYSDPYGNQSNDYGNDSGAASASSGFPPIPPPIPSAAPVSRAPNLLDQIHAGKTLKPASAGDWVQVRDPDSGQYYYENTKTGESTWDKPAEFGITNNSSTNTAGGGGGGGGGDLQGALKNTLDRYRQFVQDEEDDINDHGGDDWDEN